MKPVLTILFLGAFTWATQAQDLGSIHGYLADIEGSISMDIDMDLDDIFDGEVNGYSVEGDAHRTKFSVISESEYDMDEIYHYVYNALNRSGLKKLVIEESDDGQAFIFVEETGRNVEEVYAFIISDEDVLVFATVYGNFIITEED